MKNTTHYFWFFFFLLAFTLSGCATNKRIVSTEVPRPTGKDIEHNTPMNTYAEKISHTHSHETKVSSAMPSTPIPENTPLPGTTAPITSPPMDGTPISKSGDMHWLFWSGVVLLGAVIFWRLWKLGLWQNLPAEIKRAVEFSSYIIAIILFITFLTIGFCNYIRQNYCAFWDDKLTGVGFIFVVFSFFLLLVDLIVLPRFQNPDNESLKILRAAVPLAMAIVSIFAFSCFGIAYWSETHAAVKCNNLNVVTGLVPSVVSAAGIFKGAWTVIKQVYFRT